MDSVPLDSQASNILVVLKTLYKARKRFRVFYFFVSYTNVIKRDEWFFGVLRMYQNCLEIAYDEGAQYFILRVPFERRNEVQKIGGIWEPSKKGWKFAVDLKIWEEVKKQFGGSGGTVPRRFLNRIESLEREQNKFLEFKRIAEEDNPVDYAVDGISLNGKNPLFNYQKWGIKCGLMVGDGFLIGDSPGLGKSIQSLGIALQRKKDGDIQSCLIICLASLKYNWLAEIEKFTKEHALVIDGTKEERKKKWCAVGYFFKIVNYEIVVKDLFVEKAELNPRYNSRPDFDRKLTQKLDSEEIEFRKYMQKQFDMVIVDEIHAIKTHKSQRTRALKQLVARYRLGLSGTPIDGRLEELHSIFGFLKPGLFESKARFMERHAVFDNFGNPKAYVNVQEVRDKITPYYIRRQKEKVLKDLPAKLHKDIYVELGKAEYKLYKDIIKGAHEITEEDQAVIRLIRTRQFLDFPELLKLHNKSDKFLALTELLNELIDENKEKVLLFTQYKQVLDLLVFNLKNRYNILQIHGDVDAKERVKIVDKFNNERTSQILIGTDAMSTGLNIGGANSVINYEDNFSPAIMQQRADRAHRATTKHNVTVYRFICKDTIEENVRRALGNKMDVNNSVLDENCTEFGVNSLSNLDLLKYL